jgi:hypothetical protein
MASTSQMSDVSVPIRPLSPVFANVPWARFGKLLLAFLIALNWSAVLTKTEDRCESSGGFSSGFSPGYETNRCECKTPSLDFSDPCNSMYIPAL